MWKRSHRLAATTFHACLMFNYLKYNFKIFIYLIVFIGHSSSISGSYDDFFLAIERNNAYDLNALLERGFDPNTVNPKGQPALLVALQTNAFATAEALVAQPLIHIEVRTAKDESALMLAALKGRFALCRQMLERNADVNKPGWTPLHYAATGGHAEIVRLLLEHYAYIDAESPNGSTPLMMAAMYGTSDVVAVLLEAGADPSLRNALGLSALDFATKAKATVSVELIAAAIRRSKAQTGW